MLENITSPSITVDATRLEVYTLDVIMVEPESVLVRNDEVPILEM
jgi:hypothetical protein